MDPLEGGDRPRSLTLAKNSVKVSATNASSKQNRRVT